MTKWNRITIHHTATPVDWTLADIRRGHILERGWSDIGYHWLVGGGGLNHVEMARPMYRTGAHAYRANTGNIGVAIVGDYSHAEPPQVLLFLTAEVCAALCASHGIRTDAIVPHRSLRETVCPGMVPMVKLRNLVAALRSGRYPRALDIFTES